MWGDQFLLHMEIKYFLPLAIWDNLTDTEQL